MRVVDLVKTRECAINLKYNSFYINSCEKKSGMLSYNCTIRYMYNEIVTNCSVWTCSCYSLIMSFNKNMIYRRFVFFHICIETYHRRTEVSYMRIHSRQSILKVHQNNSVSWTVISTTEITGGGLGCQNRTCTSWTRTFYDLLFNCYMWKKKKIFQRLTNFINH